MTGKEALKKIIYDYDFKRKIETGYVYHTEIPFMEAISNIMKDLEILEILKKYYNAGLIEYWKMNETEINKLKEWLKDE